MLQGRVQFPCPVKFVKFVVDLNQPATKKEARNFFEI